MNIISQLILPNALLLRPLVFLKGTKQFDSHNLHWPQLYSHSYNAPTTLLSLPTLGHFLFNIETFPLLKPILAKTTPHLPYFFSFSFPVKTILLFNPTGSMRGRVGGKLTAANSLPNDHPPPPPPPSSTFREPWLEKMSKGRDAEKRERYTTATSKETHTFNTSFQQEKAAVTLESPVGLSIPSAKQLRHRLGHISREDR